MPYKDPEKQKAAQRRHYEKNREAYMERARRTSKQRREALRAHVRSVKENTPCAECERIFPYVVMDFHHREADDKVDTICQLCHAGVPLERLKEEIAKCDLLCANCHRLRHLGWRLT